MRVGSAESLQGGPGEASGLGAEHRGGEVPEAQQRHTLPLGPSLGSEQSTGAGRCQSYSRGTHFTSAHRWAQSRAPGRGGARGTTEAHTSPRPILCPRQTGLPAGGLGC